jgi:excisionase family DNA binding protein
MTQTIEHGVMKLFSIKDVSQILNVSRSQVYVLLKTEELRSVTIRGSRRVTENQLIQYINTLEQRSS